MEKYGIGAFVDLLVKNGVDSLDKFCSMTDSNFEDIGLNVGHKLKCISAAKEIKRHHSSRAEQADTLV